MNVLLDTNVYIDYLGRQEPFYDAAREIVMHGFFGEATIWVPAQSVADAYYVLKKHVQNASVQQAIEASFEVITPVDLCAGDILRAVRLKWEDLEDCLIAVAADKARADYLITRDVRGFERSPVPAVSPEEWLDIMERSRGTIYSATKL